MAMKIETYYECPICHSSWPTRSAAIACRNQHPVIEKRWANCEVCGQGWNIAYWGEKQAAELARKCEQEHEAKGETEELSRRTFFLSGGTKGKYYPPRKESK